MADRTTFSVVDYCVFVGVLVFSLLIGVYHAFRGRNQQTNEEVLLGGRKMTIMPVAISIMASFLSAILILGSPAEMYNNGVEYWIAVLAFVFITPLVSNLFVPIFYRCGLTSVYEYIDFRFDNKLLRASCVFLYLVRNLCYMAIALYAPSLALSSTTSLSLEASIISTALVGTLYTTFGGLKAVVWADVLQAIVMAAGMIAIVVQGAINVGGFVNIFTINAENERMHLFNFNIDPWQRHNFWNIFFGTLFMWSAVMGADQAAVQRYLSLPSLKAARWACLLNAPANMFYMSLACLAGLAIFATYSTCDPLQMGVIERKDQLVPYFVLDQMSYLTGLPGLFVACIMSGALSTISSGLNSLAAITWTDFLSNFVVFQRMSPQGQSWITRIVSFAYGCVAVGMAFIVSNLGGVLQASLAINGAIGGPIFGVFCLGIFFPFANAKGGLVGLYTSFAFSLWVVIGAYLTGGQPKKLPTSIEGCGTNLTSLVENPTIAPLEVGAKEPDELSAIEHYIYGFSYQLFNLIGCVLCVVIGSIVSLLTGCNRQEVDPSLVNPLAYKLFNCLNFGRRQDSSDKQYAADNPMFTMPTYKQNAAD